MTYTPSQEKAFESLLRKVRGQDPFSIVATVAALALDTEFRKLGIPPTVRALAELMRSPAWTAFVKDYEEVRRARAVAEAIGLVPDHLARLMADEMRTEMHKRRGRNRPSAADAAAALELGSALYGDAAPPAPPRPASTPATRDMLTGSTYLDNTGPSSAAAARPLGASTAAPTKGGETAPREPSVSIAEDALAVFSTGDDQ